MEKSEKQLTSSDDSKELEIPSKRQRLLENCMSDLSIYKKKKKRKNSENKSAEELIVFEKKVKIQENTSFTDNDAENETAKENTSNKSTEKNSKITNVSEKVSKPPKKEKVQLTGESLKSSLQLECSFDVVRKFVTACQEYKNRDMAAEYLEEGGSILEILKTFDTTDKKNINNITTLFSAVHILIIKIIGLYPEDTEQYLNTEEACKRVINTHMSSIQLMLSSKSNAKQRRVVLQMLTSVVSIGGTLPRDILSNLSLNSQVLEALIRLTKPGDPNNVRTCFIHFILAFLVDGRNNVIRALLEKRDVLTSIFPDLIYDSHNTVYLVLTTVKKFVLENLSISKTTKLHIFSTPVIQSLVNLYNWKGPRNWPGLKKVKEEIKVEKFNPEEKEIAIEAVHEFVLTLLTSKKHGIIFEDRTLGFGESRKSNHLVNTVLKSLECPWEYDKPGDLVVHILRVCPDLIKSQISFTEPHLTPKASINWIKLIRFLNQVIKSINSEKCFQNIKHFSEISIERLANTVINLTLPTIVLKKAIAPALLQNSITVRHESILLFTTMLNQVKHFILLAETSFDSRKFKAFNNYLTEYMADNSPVFERCLRTWEKALEFIEFKRSEEEIGIPTETILISILDLLKVFNETFPALVYVNVETDVDVTMLLSGLSKPLDIEENFQSELHVLAIDFLLTMDPFMFHPTQEMYGKVLSFLIMALEDKSPLLDKIKDSIAKLLEVPRAFYECENQIEIWFNAFLGLKNFEERLELSLWFVKVVSRVFKHVEYYYLAIRKAEEHSGIKVEKEISFFEEIKASGAYYVESKERLLDVSSLPLVLYSALDSLKKKSTQTLIRFMNEILMHTLYYQVNPEPLVYLTKSIKELKLEQYL